MDAIEEILKHPAYASVQQEAIVKKRIEVLNLLNELKSLIASTKFTVKGPSDPDGFAHYKECSAKYNNICLDRDTIDFCYCCQIGYRRHQILQLLDDIESLGGEDRLNRLKRFFSHQKSRWHRRTQTS